MSKDVKFDASDDLVATAFRLKDGCETYILTHDNKLVKSQPPFG